MSREMARLRLSRVPIHAELQHDAIARDARLRDHVLGVWDGPEPVDLPDLRQRGMRAVRQRARVRALGGHGPLLRHGHREPARLGLRWRRLRPSPHPE